MAMNKSQGQPGDNQRSDFKGASIPNRIGYRFLDLDPGAQIYVQRDDQLVIQVMSSIAAEVVNIGVRTVIPGRDAGRTQPDASTQDNKLGDSPYGAVIPLNAAIPIPTANTTVTKVFTLSEGFLLSISLSSTASRTRGQTFAKAFIVRGAASVANSAYTLCADYITANSPIGFPYGRVLSPVESNGLLTATAITQPGAGSDFNATPSSFQRWRIVSMQATFTASATVATRNIAFKSNYTVLTLDTGLYPANLAVTAGQSVTVTAAPGLVASALIPADLTIVLPDQFTLFNNGSGVLTLNSVTQNIQAGDQWSNIFIHYEQWLDF